MYVTSTGLIDGVIDHRFGGHGTEFNDHGVPTRSLPIKIEDAPEGTVCFALVLEDKDACPVTGGFTWIHWLAANITRNELLENESQTADDFVQGCNSWISLQGNQQSREQSSFYGGMMPPDRAHLYELHVYALDTTLDLKPGFLFNELHRAMDGHILAMATLKGHYDQL